MSFRTLSVVLSLAAVVTAQVTPPCSQYDPTKKVSTTTYVLDDDVYTSVVFFFRETKKIWT